MERQARVRGLEDSMFVRKTTLPTLQSLSKLRRSVLQEGYTGPKIHARWEGNPNRQNHLGKEGQRQRMNTYWFQNLLPS